MLYCLCNINVNESALLKICVIRTSAILLVIAITLNVKKGPVYPVGLYGNNGS